MTAELNWVVRNLLDSGTSKQQSLDEHIWGYLVKTVVKRVASRRARLHLFVDQPG